jgi:hypothetical protein
MQQTTVCRRQRALAANLEIQLAITHFPKSEARARRGWPKWSGAAHAPLLRRILPFLLSQITHRPQIFDRNVETFPPALTSFESNRGFFSELVCSILLAVCTGKCGFPCRVQSNNANWSQGMPLEFRGSKVYLPTRNNFIKNGHKICNCRSVLKMRKLTKKFIGLLGEGNKLDLN